jgi:transcriptional regulator of heat shock response
MISNRQEKLLNILIGQYIKNPEPVSSKALAELGEFNYVKSSQQMRRSPPKRTLLRSSGASKGILSRSYVGLRQLSSQRRIKSGPFSLSSATIRCEMNELEKAGYLIHLHTSSGRIPTTRAYRLYVDNIMADPAIYVPEITKRKIHKAITDAGDDPEELNRVVANIVSVLSDNIVVTNIKNSDRFYKTGLSSLFELPEFREFERVFNMASVFDHFERIFGQIDSEFFGINDDDITILVGDESPVKNMKEESVILVRYPLPNRKTGSMTIIGPMRMNYEKNIGLARCVIDGFKQKFAKQI